MPTTRFYLPSATDAPGISPGFDANWDKTSQADRLQMNMAKMATAMTSKTCSENVSTNPYNVLTRQYISPPLAAQTISGNVKGQIRCQEDNTAADFCKALVIKVVDSTGALRGTLLQLFPVSLASEFNQPSLQNRNFPASTALGSVVCQAGDRLVIEVGIRSFNTVTTNYTATHRFGDATGSDLAEDETTTTDNNPWIEFDSAITFLYAMNATQVLAEVEYDDVPQMQASQILLEVEYDVPQVNLIAVAQEAPQVEFDSDTAIKVSQGVSEIEYDHYTFLEISQLIAQIEYWTAFASLQGGVQVVQINRFAAGKKDRKPTSTDILTLGGAGANLGSGLPVSQVIAQVEYTTS